MLLIKVVVFLNMRLISFMLSFSIVAVEQYYFVVYYLTVILVLIKSLFLYSMISVNLSPMKYHSVGLKK